MSYQYTAKPSAVPKNWPPSVTYLDRPSLSPRIDAETRRLLSPDGKLGKSAASPTRIRAITDPAHPACGQNGLFAARDLAEGGHIVDYLGRYHLPADSDPMSDYDLTFRDDGRGLHLAIDAAREGNEARMVNDYRGTGGRENAVFQTYVVPGTGEVRMGIFVKRTQHGKGIKKGTEILVSYGKGFWNNRQ